MNPASWALPLMSLVSVLAWAGVLSRSMELMHRGDHAPQWAVVGLLGLAFLTSVLLFVSSFTYPGLLDTDGARFVVSILRVTVFTAGVVAFVAIRNHEGRVR